MDLSIFTDPVRIGPGIWFALHTQALKATTDKLKDAFILNVNAICDNFKCKKCQPHFRKFIDTHNLKNYWKIFDSKGRDIGFFKWTWELHNQVNHFLKKYEPGLQEAYDYFSDTEAGACFDCGGAQPAHPEQPKPEVSKAAIPPVLEIWRNSSAVKPKPFLPAGK
jgi:hypothetical protein